MRKFRIGRICGLLFVCAVAAQARTLKTPAANSAGCETLEFQAAHLDGTAVKFSIILPGDYTGGDRRFPVLYLLHGYGGHHSDWCERTHIVDYAKPYEEIIVMPEGENGWYINNYTNPKMQWENYIIEDLIPYVDAHYRTVASRDGRAIAGLSMGGYGAMFLGLKHHEMFSGRGEPQRRCWKRRYEALGQAVNKEQANEKRKSRRPTDDLRRFWAGKKFRAQGRRSVSADSQAYARELSAALSGDWMGRQPARRKP